MMQRKVLVVAPSRKTRGGITAVVKAYSQTSLWTDWHCYWIETHIDRGALQKASYFVRSFFKYLVKLPGYPIVHIHFSEPVSAIRKSFFFLPAYLLRKKIILHFHSFSPETTIKSKYRKLYQFLFTRADRAVVLSGFWAGQVRNEFGKKVDPVIIYNPSIQVPAGLVKKPSTTSYILFAGTLNERKGFRDLIKAFALIADRYPNWKIVFAGNGEIEAGKLLASELNITGQVEFAGWISGAEKDEMFTNASVFCLPSYAEGFPMSILDAMSYSVPVIATPVGGIMDVFKDGEHLLIFQPGDTGELSQQLSRLIGDARLRETLVANAGVVLRQQFELSKVVESVDRLYQAIANS